MFYEMDIAGYRRKLPLCKVTEDLYIAAFVMFNDVEITKAAASELLKRAPEFDVIVTAEAKGIPLAYEMARQANKDYIVCRKGPKLYMKNLINIDVFSITTDRIQELCIGEDEVNAMKGRKVLIVDDVVSTGGSLASIEALLGQVDLEIVGRMCVLAEGEAISRGDIEYIAELPIFNKDGSIKK